ncbi:MAG: 16S rRNA (guanine(966)-N(2))-methyltransferase RsmD [Clostridia bacterium]|nr:16S rRNA (guanine(966)-N(2))-methyltransferase RsmD [Clostridia bacterium]
MRIISGRLRGKALEAPKGMTTRPTTDKVKESIFNIIQFDLPDARVLDLFAGSGQLGLEALSRGAQSCVFVERDRASAAAVEKNIRACNLQPGEAKLYKGDAIGFLAMQKEHSYDIILLDPPYGGELLRRALADIAQYDILAEGGMILCEKAPEDVIEPLPEGYSLLREYKYGQIMLCKVARTEGEENA